MKNDCQIITGYRTFKLRINAKDNYRTFKFLKSYFIRPPSLVGQKKLCENHA